VKNLSCLQFLVQNAISFKNIGFLIISGINFSGGGNFKLQFQIAYFKTETPPFVGVT
jgi:hypothetical protein